MKLILLALFLQNVLWGTTIHPYGFGGPAAFTMAAAGGHTGNGIGHFAVSNVNVNPADVQIFGGLGLQSANANYTVIPGNAASAQASASLGVLRAAASFSDATGGFANHSGAIADLGWLDLYTISDPLYNGQAGVLNFLLHADGTLDSSTWGSSSWSISAATNSTTLDFLTQQGCDSRFVNPCAVPVNSTYVVSVPFVFGVSFEMLIRSLVTAGMPSVGDSVPPGAAGSVNFLNTIYWAGIQSVTVGGTPITGFTISAASGLDYTLSLEPNGEAPEPATLPVVASSFLVAWAIRRRVHSNKGGNK